ncbi:MAG: creatininase family protein [Balneolales bacterium]
MHSVNQKDKDLPGSQRPYILAETNWNTVKDTNYTVAVLPWGATEAHNYHLPYATDNIQCDHLAAESARVAWERGAKVIVLPTIPFGVNTGQLDIKLDINMNPSTQQAVLEDILDSLEQQGIEKLVILNGHGGNDFKQIIRELQPRNEVFLCAINWFKIGDVSTIFEEPGDHAGELETSLMMHIAPQFVQPLSQAGDGAERKFKIKALRENWAWAQREWSEVTEDTGVGNPAASTPEKGHQLFQMVTKEIGELLFDLHVADIDDLYE